MEIGHRIKEYRFKYNMTQKELAEKLHVTFQAISKWENDESEPSFDTLIQITEIFDCTMNDLFNIKESKNVRK